jgi:hypothetical protein
MKIYFCDGCNESIPLADIQAGQVTTIKGKLFCRNCIPPGSGTPAGVDAPAARRGTHPLVVVVLLGLIGYLVWRDLPRLTAVVSGDDEAAAELQDTGEDARWEALNVRLDGLVTDLDEVERQNMLHRGAQDEARSVAADVARGLDQLRDELDAVQRGQAETGQLIEKLQFQENRTQDLEKRINVVADAVARQATAVPAAGVQGPVATAVPAEAAPAPDATLQAELESIRKRLLDPDAGHRFDAVERIGGGRYKQLAPNLLPVLEDEDAFVRIRAMQVLGDFGYVEAVPALFDVLEDPLPLIRKQAAETLLRLTGYDADYDPRGTKPERDKAVRKWRELAGAAATK